MSGPLLAFAAAALGVVAAWDLAAAVEHAAIVAAVERRLSPLRIREPRETAAQAAARHRVAMLVAAAGAAAGCVSAGPAAALLGGAAAPVVLTQALALRRARWRTALRDGAPAAARAIADGLAAGRSVHAAITGAAAAGGCGPAVDAELCRAAAALAVGAPVAAVLDGLRDRAASPAWDAIVAAVLLQAHAGGDLAGLLRGLAADLDAARRQRAAAEGATAQARATARLVAGLPLGALLLGELLAPGSLAAMLARPLPATLLGTAGVLEGVGLLLVRRIARLEARP